MQNIRN